MAPVVSMVGPKTPHGKDTNISEVNQNIQVFVRCRPLKANERKNVVEVLSDRREVRVNENKSVATDRFNTKIFTFDNTFNSDTPQIEVYRSVVEPLIEQVVMGYNCTVFAYGQTGTGKTYTMEGERSTDDTCSWENDPICGIVPRALHQLFESIQTQNTEHTVRVSFLELYNEELYDLLSAIDDTTKLKIYEDSARKGSTIVGGLEEITVHTKAEIYDILRKGSAKRQTASTLMNACSSRSHTIFSVTVHIKENSIDGEDLVKIGKLNLVDLAGSENIGRSGAIDKRAREAGNINQSLLTLGRVITCLVDRAPHIPYRESKLTRLLQDSLGGRTKTSIIATISPDILDVEDTLSTLEYAQRAKKITNKPEINQKLSKKTLLKEYTAEIERLRRDLAACREKNGIYINEDNYNAMEEQIKIQNEEIETKSAQIQALSDEIAKITLLFDETKEKLDTKSEELEETSKCLKTTSVELKRTQINLHVTQVERNEQKHLVEVHSTSEKLLTDQAKQLINVADKTTSDVGKLHQKVDRQKNIEITNKKRTDEFREKFLNDMLTLEDLVNMTTDSYHDNLQEMQNAIKEKFENVGQIVSDAQNKVLSLNNSINDHKNRLTSLHNKDRIVLEQSFMLRDSTNKVNTSVMLSFEDLMAKVEESQNAIQEELQSVNAIVAQQRLEVENLIMNQNTSMKSMSDVNMNAFNDIKNDMQLIFNHQNEEYLSLKSEIERIKNERINAEQSMGQKWDQLEKLINDMKVERIQENTCFQKSSSQMIDKLNEASVSNRNSDTKMAIKVDELLGKVVCERKIGLKTIETVDDLNTKNTQQIIDKINEINCKNTTFANETKALIVERKDLLEKEIKESIQVNDDMIKTTDKQLNAKQTALKDMNESLTHEMNEQKNLVSSIDENIELITECVTEKVCEMVRTATTLQKSQIREIDTRFKDFDNFVKNDLIKDIPTGTTPQKTSYSYPRDLVQTSPHERVLQRYRSTLDPNDTINISLPEEAESEVLSDSNSSVQSVSSNGTNDENMKPLTDQQKSRKARIGSKVKSNSDLKTQLESDTTFVSEKKISSKKLTPNANTKPMPLKTTSNHK